MFHILSLFHVPSYAFIKNKIEIMIEKIFFISDCGPWLIYQIQLLTCEIFFFQLQRAAIDALNFAQVSISSWLDSSRTHMIFDTYRWSLSNDQNATVNKISFISRNSFSDATLSSIYLNTFPYRFFLFFITSYATKPRHKCMKRNQFRN
jgi:hypothetical protein